MDALFVRPWPLPPCGRCVDIPVDSLFMEPAVRYDVFLSYRWIDPDQTWVREQFVPALEAAGLRVCLDIRDFTPGIDAVLEMDRALHESRKAICVLSPEYFEARRHTNFEVLWLRHADAGASVGRLIPLILRPAELPAWIAGLVPIDWTNPDLANEWRKLLLALEAPSLAVQAPVAALPRTGIATRERVLEGHGLLPGQVFAVELLTQPILITRTRNGRTRVAVNRDGVSEGLYTTEAKRELCRRVFDTPRKIEQAHARDAEIHRFLLGASGESSLMIRLEDHPLRWASGGVLSIVHWRERRWTPFFFRDIPPFGWNIALGASEKGDDLSDPFTFMLREFLEETLVLDSAPKIGAAIDFKRFLFHRYDFAREIGRAEAFASEHIQMRRRSDGLVIHYLRDPERLASLDRRFCVAPEFLSTRTDVSVERDGREQLTPNLLVCVNLLELGIEMIKIVDYELEGDDYILDGEMLDLGTHKELLRMPVALISHEYLRQAFDDRPFEYIPGTQPSIAAPSIPAEHIHIFPFDARRRREIAMGTDPNSSPWEKRWHGDWYASFGKCFFDHDGGVSGRHASAHFTPSSAKALSYYFANMRQLNAAHA